MEKTSDHQALQQELPRLRCVLFTALYIPYLIWEFTESNFATFVIPNTTFGVLGALACSRLADGQGPSILQVAQRLPIAVIFNWYNVLIFDLANQRSDESIEEDKINKPWRPIPSGKITGQQTRRSMLVAIPIAIALNYYLGVWKEGLFIQILTWLYNDLKGGDEVVRDLIISVAYGFFNHGSLSITLGTQASINQDGLVWIMIVSGVILTTMQVQDLKDQAGDRTRRRLSIPLLLGEQFSRVSIAVFVMAWSCTCSYFWGLGPWSYVFVLLMGATVSMSVLFQRTPKEDARTWKMWCFWTMCLYSLPMFATMVDY
ncbi:Fumagillin beta-trans-bergamotene synthase [Cladobotryum mycophilum]|uniref:Fumagillin beta-trans-bergamotene synthase n=1 Tax=Cladobotryum mycophilum TaxID=491253 RepID=A0ABR0SKC4_9HYPO